jgi:hypothetical protein
VRIVGSSNVGKREVGIFSRYQSGSQNQGAADGSGDGSRAAAAFAPQMHELECRLAGPAAQLFGLRAARPKDSGPGNYRVI